MGESCPPHTCSLWKELLSGTQPFFSDLHSWPDAFTGHRTGPILVNSDNNHWIFSVSETINFSGGGMAGFMSCYKLNPWLEEFGETTITPLKQIEASCITFNENWINYLELEINEDPRHAMCFTRKQPSSYLLPCLPIRSTLRLLNNWDFRYMWYTASRDVLRRRPLTACFGQFTCCSFSSSPSFSIPITKIKGSRWLFPSWVSKRYHPCIYSLLYILGMDPEKEFVAHCWTIPLMTSLYKPT